MRPSSTPSRRPDPLSWGVCALLALLAGALSGPALAAAPEAPEAPVSAAPAASEVDAAVEERWYVLELDGRPAGWSMERWWREDGRVITEEETVVRLARGESSVEVSLAGRFEETADGRPLELRTRQVLGSEPVETTYRYLAGESGEGPRGIEAVSVQAGRERREVLPAPEGEWLTPAAARRAAAVLQAAGDRRYTLRALEPLEGPEPVTLTLTRLGEATPPAAEDGAVSRWREESSSAPGVPTVVELDAAGGLVSSSTELFGLEATTRRTDRESVVAALDAGADGGRGPEVVVRTLVRPSRPIPGHRRAERAVFELSLDDDAGGAELPPLPSGGAQRVETAGTGRLRVTVYRDAADAPPLPDAATAPRRPPPDADPVPGARAGDPAADEVTEEHLASTLYLDHRDPELRRLLDGARPADADGGSAGTPGGGDAERARRLERFVHGYVSRKDLDTGFATASEVARTRRGDCTEHAVLLAALLRAAEIPSRVVTGLVYLDTFAGTDEVFGYHMWVQAAVDSAGAESATRWIDLDPTLPWGFDATHIALGHSDLAGTGHGSGFEAMLPMLGNLRIEVVEVDSAPDD